MLLSDQALCRCCISYISCYRLRCRLNLFLAPVVLKWFVEEKDAAAHADPTAVEAFRRRG